MRLAIRALAIALRCVGWPGTALMAQEAHPVARAAQLIGVGRHAEAIAVLDSFTTANPRAPRAWLLLGRANLSIGRPAQAVTAFERGLETPASRPDALYGLGLSHFRLGRTDTAFVLLRAARATGKVDLTQMAFDQVAAPVLTDPRSSSLLPAPDEYARPFAESVAVLGEWRGERSGDQFGWIARSVGDVDGDGLSEFVTSAPTADSSAGAVYLISPRRRSPLWKVVGHGADELGTGVEAAGDVDGDGVPDIVAGAPGGEQVLLLSGRDGRVIRRISGRAPGERFGQVVSGLGDVDDDGLADVLVAGPLNSEHGAQAGQVYVVSGASGAILHTWAGTTPGAQLGQALAGEVRDGRVTVVAGAPGLPGGGGALVWDGLRAEPRFTIRPDSAAVQLGGSFVSLVGDVDGDGEPDIYASDWYDGSRGVLTGKVYVHSGATGERTLTLTGEGGGYGIGVADAGDIDRDGHDDLIVGAWQYDSLAASGGKLYLQSGKDGRTLGTVTGRVMGETLGFDATGLGDIDGDGIGDFLVTSGWSAIHGPRSGRVLILSGADVLATGRLDTGRPPE